MAEPGNGDYIVEVVAGEPGGYQVHRLGTSDTQSFVDREKAVSYAVTGAEFLGYRAYMRAADGWLPLPTAPSGANSGSPP